MPHASFLASILCLAVAQASPAAEPPVPVGEFRVARGIAAPWLDAGQSRPDLAAWRGATLGFSVARFEAPQGLGCDRPRYRVTQRQAEGLFQGNLRAPAATSAARLALVEQPVAGVEIACSSGLFDLHWATPDALLLALDNVIWVLDRSPGALAPEHSPQGVVQRLLETHFASDMGFDAESVRAKRDWLTPSLRAALESYFAQPRRADEAPPINGDPFTDSQEYPVLFSVREATVGTETARVPVRFDDGYRARTVDFVLHRVQDRWRVDDLRYGEGRRLQQELRDTSAE
jgi:hypothetical protein